MQGFWTRLKSDVAQPGQAVAGGSTLDWFLVFGLVLLITAAWGLVLKHLKGAAL